MQQQSDIDVDVSVQDEMVLRSIPGAVDYLFEELRTLRGATVTVLRRYRDALLIAYSGPLRELAAVRYFDVCSLPLDEEPARRLCRSRESGVLSALVPSRADVMFRVGDIGEDRWNLRDHIQTELDWQNSADAWDVNVERFDGELVAEIGPLYLTRRYGELERMPASTNPLIAAVMVRLAKIAEGHLVLDPFCGAGTLLVLAGETRGDIRLVGGELRPQWLAAAERNLRSRDLPALLLRADAQRLPLTDGAIDRIVSNLPFGKRIGSHRSNADLYPAALREMARVLHGGGRAVLLTDDKRLFKETVQRTPLLRVVKEIMLERSGVYPTAYVVTKRGSAGRPRGRAGRAGSGAGRPAGRGGH